MRSLNVLLFQIIILLVCGHGNISLPPYGRSHLTGGFYQGLGVTQIDSLSRMTLPPGLRNLAESFSSNTVQIN